MAALAQPAVLSRGRGSSSGCFILRSGGHQRQCGPESQESPVSQLSTELAAEKVGARHPSVAPGSPAAGMPEAVSLRLLGFTVPSLSLVEACFPVVWLFTPSPPSSSTQKPLRAPVTYRSCDPFIQTANVCQVPRGPGHRGYGEDRQPKSLPSCGLPLSGSGVGPGDKCRAIGKLRGDPCYGANLSGM